ncbi:protein FAR-RED IMPAIRED RESPONSE 1-like [Rhododendron vialii]|uniref:protein FAR-RED IMPAIRED RESPONSE 1-like n=1 Tax=Rhododendron vialii TaxID=182163 RepID=UPI00265F0BF0|nr:protein FAR-RED IMPAIRED RESPONSE 1-like [Rhododendron vialii]
MTKAFANVLPNTHHRYCIWHIVSKFSKKISALYYKKYYDEFKKCIWNSESPEEFEAKWVDVVHKANLSSNEWLKAMYEIRERWILAYMKHMFSAHMTSSQRAEISHSFFKKYVSLNNSLYDFVTRFARVLSRIRHNELDLDHKDLNEKPQLKTSFPMESTMSELYTLAIFNKFQEELFQIEAYVVKMTHEDEHCCFYNVERAKIIDVPNELILARWTKSAKVKRVVDYLGGAVKEICDTSLLESVVDEAVLTEDGSELLEEALCLVRKKLCAKDPRSEYGEGSAIQMSSPREHSFKEPLHVRAKGYDNSSQDVRLSDDNNEEDDDDGLVLPHGLMLPNVAFWNCLLHVLKLFRNTSIIQLHAACCKLHFGMNLFAAFFLELLFGNLQFGSFYNWGCFLVIREFEDLILDQCNSNYGTPGLSA